jgi:hypothetical protein
MRLRSFVQTLVLLAVPWVAGCASRVLGSHGGGDGGTTDDGGTVGGSTKCATLGPRPQSQLPHVVAGAAQAAAIFAAVDAIVAAQPEPVASGQSYAISDLSCRDYTLPMMTGTQCSFAVQIDGGQTLGMASQSEAQAEDLLAALTAAGASGCDDPHGNYVALATLTLSATAAQFDDNSLYETIPLPNVVAQGATAKSIVDAFAKAGIDDCDATRSAFLICNLAGGKPSCGYQWYSVVKVGTSELLTACGPTSGDATPGGDFSDAASLTVWNAILAAAKAAGFQPDNGGAIDVTTVINARDFSWDGDKLGINLYLGNAVPPTPDNR